MGESPQGFVFWGIPLPVDEYGEASDNPWDGTPMDDREWYASKLGIVKPDKPYKGGDPDYAAYWHASHEAAEASPCAIQEAGYQGFEVSVALVKASLVQVEWSEVKPFPTEVQPEWEEQLRHYCDLMGIEWKQPGWHIACRLS